MKSIGIIIPFFEYYEGIGSVVDSFFAFNTKHQYHVFIIDNSINRIDFKLPNKNISWIHCKASIGYGRACNVGVYHAQIHNCEYICILNQDITINDSFLDTIIDRSLTLRNSILSPVIKGEKNQNSNLFTNYYLSQDNIIKENREYYQVRNLSGACFTMKLKDYILLNGFNPLFHMYYEDVHFFYKSRKYGLNMYFVKNSKLIHYSSNENARGNSRLIIEHRKNISYIINQLLLNGLIVGIANSLKYIIKILIEILYNLKLKLLFKYIVTYSIYIPKIVWKYIFYRNVPFQKFVEKDLIYKLERYY